MENGFKLQSKGLWCVLSLLLVALMCVGCGGGKGNPDSTVDQPFEVSDVYGEELYQSELTSSTLWKLTYTYPQVSGGVKEAADVINGTIETAVEFWMETDESIFAQQQEFIPSENDGVDESMPWGDEMNYGISRNDGKVFSMSLNTYLYAGGAHGMPHNRFLNFDSKSGAELMLKDIAAVDEETLTQEVNAILVQQCEAMEQQPDNPLFDNWRDYIHMVLSDGSWYLDEDGFHTLAEVYMLAPYSHGPVDFAIPYDECSFMKEEYRK